MEKKNNKKKLFAIIGGSVLAFVLTIALSVSITLAYFGQTASDSATVTLAKELAFDGDAVTASVTAEGSVVSSTVLPGDQLDVNAIGKVAASTETYGYYLRVKISTEDFDLTSATATMTVKVGEGSATSAGTLVKPSGSEYYYLCASEGATTAKELTDRNATYTATITVTVPTSLTNEDASPATGDPVVYSFNVEMGIIQSANLDHTALVGEGGLESLWTPVEVIPAA